jgi:alpha-glucosidase
MVALFALRGAVFLYQGEELGLPQARIPFERLQDPYAVASYVGDSGRDGARTPMPWTDQQPMGGFTTATETWLPIDPAHLAGAVSVQEADPSSYLAFTRHLIALRKAHPALRVGDIAVLDAADPVLALLRTTDTERIAVVINLGPEPAAFRLACLQGGALLDCRLAAELQGDQISLPPYGGAMVRLR